MGFIIYNIMWFAGCGFVAVLAIVGYFAEKFNFGQIHDENEKPEPIVFNIKNKYKENRLRI